jgi:DNA polymerase-3 subunit gamma/tau
MEHPQVKRALEIFPGAEVTAIRETETAVEAAPDEADDDAPVDPDDDAVAEAVRKRTETGKA